MLRIFIVNSERPDSLLPNSDHLVNSQGWDITSYIKKANNEYNSYVTQPELH